MSAEADDVALLTQGKEAGESRRKINRKDEQVFKLNHYKAALSAATPMPRRAAAPKRSVP